MNPFSWRSSDRETIQPEPLMRRLMIPFSMLILVCIIGASALLYNQHRNHSQEFFHHDKAELNRDMEMLFEEQSSALSLAIKPIANNFDVQQALRAHDRQTLLMKWHNVFEKMKKENQLTHLYFLDKNRVCLLRVHAPAKYGDTINRFTALEAEWSRKISSGLEIGPMGTLTLRVVQPVIVDNELIGYIEMGKEIEDIFERLSNELDTDFAVVLRKAYLKRDQWEAGMHFLNREGDWDRLKHNALVYSSLENIPKEVVEISDRSVNDRHEIFEKNITQNRNNYRISILEVRDVSGKEVGDLLVVKNITNENLHFLDTILIGGVIALSLMSMIIAFIYFLIRRSDEGIENQQRHLYESRNLLTTIIDTIPIRVFWKSRSLHYLGCNALFAQDAGLSSPEELIDKNDYQMGWAAQAELYRADDFKVMQTGEAKLFYEEEQTTPSGETIWLRTSKVPLRNKEGEMFGILGIYEDITEHKVMENTLILNAKRLNEAQHFARMGSWTLDLKENTLIWSDEVYRIFEIDSDRFEATYESFLKGIHPEDREMVNQAYLQSLATKEPYEITHRLLMEDGRIKWVREVGMSDFNGAGEAIRSMGTVQDITERKMVEEQIDNLAYYDPLTGLPNRTLLIDRLVQAIALSARSKQFCALLFIDLDNFKTLNDTLGHGMGDNLLTQTARRLKQCVREGDSVARFGGDEFVVLLSALGSEEENAASLAERVGEKILSVLNESYELGEAPYYSTASIGITLFNGDELSVDELMKQADLAMYKSKEAGRNRLSFFDQDMELSLRAHALLEEEIRFGINDEQFCLYYQPQITEGGNISGVEVLVRWNHPQRGVVSPIEFIPIAEETGLIVSLGEWIMKKACYQIAQWSHQEAFAALSVAVNVSARQFNQKDFVEQVLAVLDETGADPKQLKLELTESILVQNVEDVIEKMEQLKTVGVRFSLDDFGTGYSSLSYLKRLPLNQLKIDQSFVRDIMSDTNDAIICKSTIALAESMGLAVIAEGVETQEQRDALYEYGCRMYQGYWFSRPLALELFESYLLDHNVQ